ncbi:short-chain dehydrogenase/reductase SDR [Kribbella flavida DSM 17836]|uniref:Short-chain dehydrogenase/reductase SDR n=1 Tax=Kribbella flavida (strain DSM 17836 / JCM 10339 / NBRC 14399) TaxID=479435 RepID=D2PYA9_KRIFD|nr:SDR family NAD(P)-dependent oxidoreductase [Kribbella flavida]ADB35477.1 short-chain dehydrogenase/reductase SDR [Kribbella flavida DSM 17836]
MKTTGNTIFITGGTSGIGLGLARELRDLGNTVIVSGRRKDLLDRIAAEDGLGTVELDVAAPASIQAAYDTVTTRYPETNVLVTMAGIMRSEDLRDPGHLAAAEQTVAINLLGTIRAITAFTPFLLGRPDAAIVTVSSGLAFTPLAATPTYSATKAAVHSYTESLRFQLAGTGVQVIELVPPAVRTALLEGREPDPQWMPLQEFLTESVQLLTDQPDAREILVERVGFLRYAEREGRFQQTFAALNSH